MPAACRAVGQPENNMNVKACLAVVADGDVPDCAQDFALFGDFDFLVNLILEIEPADCGFLEGADCCQGGSGNSNVVSEFRQCYERFFAGFQDDDAGFCSRVDRYFGAFHGRYAALRCVWRPSLTSSIILALNASK